MKSFAVKIFLLFVLGLVLGNLTGCASHEPENNAVRPWNAPQDWENGMPMINNQQHE